MKLIQQVFAFTLITTMIMACSPSSQEGQELTSKTFVADMQIEGMVCAMGCAQSIEDKLNETEGILSASVNYSEESCELEYDASKISDKEIIALIQSVNGQDHYKVNSFSSQVMQKNVSGEAPYTKDDDSEFILQGLPEIKFPNIFSIIRRL